jgi:DNA-directed RNA polymerase subunit E'/Rpb7
MNVAILDVDLSVPAQEVMALAASRGTASDAGTTGMVREALRRTLEGKYSPEHGCFVLCILDVVSPGRCGSSGGSSSRTVAGTVVREDGDAAPPAVRFEGVRFCALVFRLRVGEVLDCVVNKVHANACGHFAHCEFGPATVTVDLEMHPPDAMPVAGGVLRARTIGFHEGQRRYRAITLASEPFRAARQREEEAT